MAKDLELTPQEWHQTRWQEDDDPPFHRKTFSPSLVKYGSRLLQDGRPRRVFVPLCGKTLDLIFLADQNCEVIGLEFSQTAIQQFFKENNLGYSHVKMTSAPFLKYCAEGKNITIYQGDLFDMNRDICGEFDAVFDRGSYVAINVTMHKKYTELMSSIVKPKGRILMEALSYDANFGGPPHSITLENLEANFTDFNLETLETYDRVAGLHHKVDGMIFKARIVLLERK